MKKKLKDNRGETLVELLASILIGALSIAMLFSTLMAADRMDKRTREKDETYYANLSGAEAQKDGPTSGTVTVNGVPITVNFYGSDGAISYHLPSTSPETP